MAVKKNNDTVTEETQTEEARQVTAEKSWRIKVTNNAAYCGIGAGGVQFANGEAIIKSDRMAAWFKEHNGYEVAEQ